MVISDPRAEPGALTSPRTPVGKSRLLPNKTEADHLLAASEKLLLGLRPRSEREAWLGQTNSSPTANPSPNQPTLATVSHRMRRGVSRGCRAAASFLLILAASYSSHATLILTACSGSGVVIASDGLVLKPGSNPPSVKGCKIMQGTNDCFFVISGVRDIHRIHYDLVPMAVRACRSSGSIVERANVFEKAAFPEVQRAWKHIKAHEPATYALMDKHGPARVAVVFAGGPPFTVAIVQYVENSSGDMAIDDRIVDVGDFASESVYHAIGETQNVKAYQRQQPEIEKLPKVDFLRALLSGAIAAEQTETEKVIGIPVAILEINNEGARWIEQGACKAMNPQSNQ